MANHIMAMMKRFAAVVALTLVLKVPAAVTFRPGVIHYHQDTDTHHPQHILHRRPYHDRGYVENCGKGGGFFDLSWNPKDISPADRIQFYANFTFPADFDKVHVIGTVFYEGAHMVSIDKKYKCDDLAQQITDMFPREGLRIKCPIRRGELLSGSYFFTETEHLTGYDGLYDVRATVKDDWGNQLMCISLKVTILPFL